MVSALSRRYVPSPPLRDTTEKKYVVSGLNLNTHLNLICIFSDGVRCPYCRLTEAEEQCVYTHTVDAEEALSNEIRSHYYRLQQPEEHTPLH